MGKTKQAEKKFNRNVEISAPILDPEIIKAIHAPPKDQKLDIRQGGFKALLSDLNSQDSTDELTLITENHLPSYIGISCAVSGYSNYSSYGKKPSEESSKLNGAVKPTSHKLAPTSSRLNRSHTNSPVAVRVDQPNIHHVTIDKSHINSIEQERKELTEKLTASATERHRSPSPIPPTEDDRHHGAYVGARYFPMPEPSKQVQKHIPLLGIDDDVNPDEIVPEDGNKVEHKIASLYGDDFVEDWKESMSHKSRKEHDYGPKETQNADRQAVKNLKDLVTLKPTPQKQEEVSPAIDVPTPNIKVLAGVEKQFLNKLLTDENPPIPKSPSPQPMSPVSPKFSQAEVKQATVSEKHVTQNSSEASPVARSPTATRQQEISREIVEEIETREPEIAQASDEQQELPSLIQQDEAPLAPTPEPDILEVRHVSDVEPEEESQLTSLVSHEPPTDAPLGYGRTPELMLEPESLIGLSETQEISRNDVQQTDLIDTLNDELESAQHDQGASQEVLRDVPTDSHEEDLRGQNQELIQIDNNEEQSQFSPIGLEDRLGSPDSQISSSTVERAPVHAATIDEAGDHESITREHEDKPQTPVQELASDLMDSFKEHEDSSLVMAREIITQETGNLVSFSPEPTAETNNNVEQQQKQASDLIGSEIVEAPEKYSPELASIQETAEIAAQPEATVNDDAGSTETKIDGNYFLNLLKSEESFIMEQVRKAEEKLAEHGSEMDEDKLGKMHSAIGKANLLINKKCNQFRGLCEQSLASDGKEQYAVLSDDLAGFWDMICIQIADVRKSFENL